MSRATLIWSGGPEKPYRTYTFPKNIVLTAIWGSGILAVLSIILILAVGFQIASLSEKSTTISEQSETIRNLEAQNTELGQDYDQINSELEEVRELESKVRVFLGLETEESSEGLSNQGGEAPSDALPPDQSDAEIIQGQLDGLDMPEASPIMSSADSLAEVLFYLEDKQAQMLHVPTILPVKGEGLWLSCYFGWRKNPITGIGKEFHNGLDIAGQWRSEIIAPADGTVVRSGKDRYLGNYVKLRHSSGIKTSYGHLESSAVKVGQKVKRGDLIGYMGNTGRTTGTHLHYAVVKDDRFVDPIQYIWDGPNNPLARK